MFSWSSVKIMASTLWPWLQFRKPSPRQERSQSCVLLSEKKRWKRHFFVNAKMKKKELKHKNAVHGARKFESSPFRRAAVIVFFPLVLQKYMSEPETSRSWDKSANLTSLVPRNEANCAQEFLRDLWLVVGLLCRPHLDGVESHLTVGVINQWLKSGYRPELQSRVLPASCDRDPGQFKKWKSVLCAAVHLILGTGVHPMKREALSNTTSLKNTRKVTIESTSPDQCLGTIHPNPFQCRYPESPVSAEV